MPGLLTKGERAARLRFGRPHLRCANLHRDRAEWLEAVIAYRRALEWLPWRDDLSVQLGNCLKEMGEHRAATAAYAAVTDGEHRPEALRQMADARRRAGIGILPYATGGAPARLGATGPADRVARPSARDLPGRLHVEEREPRRWLGPLGTAGGAARGRGLHHPAILLDQVGCLSLVCNGTAEPLLAGVVAVRARIAAPRRLETVELWLGEGARARRVAVEPVRAVERGVAALPLHVLNAWIDAGRLPPGRHWLEIRAGRSPAPTGLFVNVADPAAAPSGLEGSDAYVPSPAAGDPAAAVVAAPATARPAARSLFDRPIRSVLAMRVDQLGDVSASLPALARLRALFADARLTVLVQPAVAAMVVASGLADEVLTVTLGYDALTERRHLAPEEEVRLSAACAGRSFDLAIDLSPAQESRPLLLLTGATWLVGFDADRFGFLDFGVGVRSRDKANQLDRIAHAATVSTLIEGLAAAIAKRPPVPRVAPSRPHLDAHGLTRGGYVVLHMGARHPINRWPAERFLALAARLIAATAHDVVIFADDALVPRDLPADRARVLGVIDGDAFDAILSSARLVIANDSGPKHLAAVRGVPTVSIHVGRLNWNEWGQEGEGAILSKRVPCAGCGLNEIQLCGRDAVCVRAIAVDEVWDAARPWL
ncbi:glycosyltransferase family 9 protein [Sphingomonas sp.]|uniref:glycosyltransferase family 9 protein n=1 Tax=Sphingomonas sp. TaxID=28214 RepID=UPI003B00D01E